jgi:two-component system chemotaxis sensor kinase CheA
LIDLEQAADPERRQSVVETVFRGAHSLKGAARAVGIAEIETICQRLESVFSRLKSQQLELSATLFDVMHDAVDMLGKMVQSIGAGQAAVSGRPPVAALLKRLDRAVTPGGAASATAVPFAPPTEPEPPRTRIAPGASDDKPLLADTVRIATASLDALLFRAEGMLGAKLATAERAAQLREAVTTLAEIEKQHGELLAGVLKSFGTRLGALARAAERDTRALAGMVDGLLEDMKRALMLPVSSVLDVLPKVVRDVARSRGKEVEVVVRGGDIEIDRRILEQMRDPLIHLVRNSVDHGIEAPEERRQRGKVPQGSITVAVTQKDGGRIEILLADDGGGIDLAAVQASAQKAGLLFAEGTDPVSLVFQSGVSTSPIITDISGRGLGLAIVRERVERLGGQVSVDTTPGVGTTFRIVVPLTLATFRGIAVRVRGELLMLPTTHVDQAVRVSRDVVKTVENHETIEWAGRAIALVDLADVLEMPPRVAVDAGDTIHAVILGSGHKRIAFRVDEIVDEQEILVKPLGAQLSRVRNVAGATVLGTGKAVPILDVPDLLRSAVRTAMTDTASQAPDESAGDVSILVAEDSVTSRALLRTILQSAGYRVSTAVDGLDAYTQLKTDRFDLVVSDVEMPRLSGFELTAKIRADAALAEMPVVLVTALSSPEDRARGIDSGANAYIVKSSFDQSNLLEVIRRLV